MDKNTAPVSPYAIRNVRLFIAFKVFFNARFYYSVFTILFLDFGLTMAQFALLNAIWAATIVLAEVPSGALADIMGRRKLMVWAGAVMVVEILLLCIVPRGNPGLLFGVFVLNRILSGLAEASASGADEAIAYDALKAAGMQADWGRVLAMSIRLQSIGFIVAMTLGAVVYDPAFMQKASDWLGLHVTFTRDTTLRLPLYLTLGMAVLTLAAALRMEESGNGLENGDNHPAEISGVPAREAFAMTLRAGRWILETPFALVIICSGFLFDSIARMVITLSSQYYRVIQVPEAVFGLIGSGIAVLGLIIPRIALWMTERNSPRYNLLALAGVNLVGLIGMAFFIPLAGLIPAIILFSGMYMTGFFVSHYLNHITNSAQRATVLSFKGLSYNLSYGLIGLLYSLLVAWTRPDIVNNYPGQSAYQIENLTFMATFNWFPGTFILGFAILCLFAGRRLRGLDVHRKPLEADSGDHG